MPLTSAEECRLIRAWQLKKSEPARDIVIRSYMSLVPWTVKKMRMWGFRDREDLISAGNMGLLDAMDKFNTSLGHRFSTYAVFWVRCRIMDAAKSFEIVKVPDKVARNDKDARKRSRGVGTLMQAYLERTGTLSVDGGAQVSDMIDDDWLSKRSAELRGAMVGLTKRERYVVTERWLGDEMRTLESISIDLDLTRERVRQIEKIALGKVGNVLRGQLH